MSLSLCLVFSAIMRLSNGLVYDMALKCGSQAVADALLHLPQQEILNNKQHWMQYALGTQPVVFLDTDKVQFGDFHVKSKKNNKKL